MSDRDLVRQHIASLIEAGDAAGIPRDVVGRHALAEIVNLWLESRSIEDVAGELQFTIESLDPEHDFEFMRP